MQNRIIILFAAAVLVCTAVSITVFGVSGQAYAAEHKKSSGEKKEGEEGVKNPDYEYLELSPLILPIITDLGVTQQVSLLISLEVPYGEKAAVEEYKPRLSDAYLQDLYGALGEGVGLMRGSLIDVPALKGRLTSVTEKVIGKEKFHDVLLQVVQQRPM